MSAQSLRKFSAALSGKGGYQQVYLCEQADKLIASLREQRAADVVALGLKDDEIASLRDQLKSAQRGALPKEPPIGLLMSMALRLDHALGCEGYYDQYGDGKVTHARRLECALSDMRKVYEEISGQGFYKPEREAEYAAMTGSALKEQTP